MFRNYFLINLLLVVVISLLGVKFYNVTAQRVELPSVSMSQEKQSKESFVDRVERPVNTSAYEVISRLDLFRPSRSLAEKKEVQAEKGPPKNPPKLFGTIILNNLKTAILEDPDSRSTKSYSINDTVAGYVISDILEDKVLLMRDGESFEVKLRESKGITPPKRRNVSRRPTRRTRNTANTVRRRRRPQRTRRPVTPRTTTAPADTQHNQDLPEDVKNLIDDLEEIEE